MPNDFFSSPFFHARPIFRIGFYSSRLYIFSVSVINTIQLWHCERYCFFLKQCFFSSFTMIVRRYETERSLNFFHIFLTPEHIYCVRKYILKYQQLVINDLPSSSFSLVSFFLSKPFFIEYIAQGLRGFKTALYRLSFFFSTIFTFGILILHTNQQNHI